MQRSRLKNIINKSKSISNKQEVGNPFDEFKKSLPIEIDDNYRLEAAWKAYGSPKDYKTALWNGMIQPIDETNVKLPSIGYNEETDEYEYLNKGEDNETVAKDIRVWDNDVIPLVQELKLGGYVRTFNKEKDCWTYTKNSQKREQPIEDKREQVIDSFQKGGNGMSLRSTGEYTSDGQELYDDGTGNLYTLQPQAFKQGGQLNVIPEGALHCRKNGMELAKEGEITHKGVPVVDNDGEQQAEIEREEWTMTKELTDDVEKWYHKYYNKETSEKDKDELAIKCGKRITKELLHNTDDRANLIAKMLEEE